MNLVFKIKKQRNNNTNSDDMDNNVEVNDDKNAKSTTHTG